MQRWTLGLLRALRALLPYFAFLIIVVSAANFLWMFGDMSRFGGSALNGYVRDGHYYLALHGSYTEVSQAIWERVRLDELRVWLSVPLTIVSFGYLLFGSVFPFFMGLRQGTVVAERVQGVRTSGERLASGRCGGNIAGISLSWPLLCVEVYPDGMTIRPFSKRPTAILAAELKRVEWQSQGWRVQITHASPDIMSPITLYVAKGSEIGAGIDELLTKPGLDR